MSERDYVDAHVKQNEFICVKPSRCVHLVTPASISQVEVTFSEALGFIGLKLLC